jgi:hypothetical protein
MEYARQINADVTVVSTDYAQAYGMVQHEPLFTIARKIGGEGYESESWLRTMYVGHKRFIVVNGVIWRCGFDSQLPCQQTKYVRSGIPMSIRDLCFPPPFTSSFG